VRWILNRPAWFTGSEMDHDESDYVIVFTPQIDSRLPILNLPLIDPTVFFPKDVPGNGSLLWIGKGALPNDFGLHRSTLITGDWPTSRQELACLLRKAEVLYSCDWLTSLVGESLLCSTPVVLLGPQDWSEQDIQMWPGMTWFEDNGIEDAKSEVLAFYPHYLEAIRSADAAVAGFVREVTRHFG